jgi:hypothetical protein
MQRPFPNGYKCPFGYVHVRNGRGRWPKPTALFWFGDLYGTFNWYYLGSQLPFPGNTAGLTFALDLEANATGPLKSESEIPTVVPGPLGYL